MSAAPIVVSAVVFFGKWDRGNSLRQQGRIGFAARWRDRLR
jgi:hypothetical protein